MLTPLLLVGKYIAHKAVEYTQERKERFKRMRKFIEKERHFVEKHLREFQWSQEQIVGYCKQQHIEMVSVERIYQHIRQDKLNGGDLYKHTRHRLKSRKRPVGGKYSPIKNKVMIDQRPEIINNKNRFGDWEIDTIVGKNNNGAILTIVERKTGFLMMKTLNGKNAKELAKALYDVTLQKSAPFHYK